MGENGWTIYHSIIVVVIFIVIAIAAITGIPDNSTTFAVFAVVIYLSTATRITES
jgi:hypothetical protein